MNKSIFTPDKQEAFKRSLKMFNNLQLNALSTPTEWNEEGLQYEVICQYCALQSAAIISYDGFVSLLRNEDYHQGGKWGCGTCPCNWSKGKIMKSPCFKEFQPELIRLSNEAGLGPTAILHAVKLEDFTMSMKEQWPKIRADFIGLKNERCK